MATNPSTLPENSGRITAPNADYSYGSAKNDSTGSTGDGTPIQQDLMNDSYGLQQALLRASGITPSGNAETQIASQYLQAIIEQAAGRASAVVESAGSVADVYVVEPSSNNQSPASLFDGMTIKFRASSANITNTPTLNAFGLGAITVTNIDGSAVSPGQIRAGGRFNTLIHNSVLNTWMLTDKSVPVVNFNVGLTTSLISNSASIAVFSVNPTLNKGIWSTIGPTGSGAQYIWGALNIVPLNAKSLILLAGVQGSHNAIEFRYTSLSIRSTGSVVSGLRAEKASWYGQTGLGDTIRNVNECTVPIDAANTFSAMWDGSVFWGNSNNIDLMLLGWSE